MGEKTEGFTIIPRFKTHQKTVLDSLAFNMYDKVNVFIKKVKLWERNCEGRDASWFPLLVTILPPLAEALR